MNSSGKAIAVFITLAVIPILFLRVRREIAVIPIPGSSQLHATVERRTWRMSEHEETWLGVSGKGTRKLFYDIPYTGIPPEPGPIEVFGLNCDGKLFIRLKLPPIIRGGDDSWGDLALPKDILIDIVKFRTYSIHLCGGNVYACEFIEDPRSLFMELNPETSEPYPRSSSEGYSPMVATELLPDCDWKGTRIGTIAIRDLTFTPSKATSLKIQ